MNITLNINNDFNINYKLYISKVVIYCVYECIQSLNIMYYKLPRSIKESFGLPR